MSKIYLNGEYVAPDAARVSVFDRGFVFGDGVYEVIPVYGGRLFRFGHHMERLQQSLDSVSLQNPMAPQDWLKVLQGLIEDKGDHSVYLQVTRGVAPRDHSFPRGAQPTVFAYSQPLVPPSATVLRDGVAAITIQDVRWQRCDVKSISLLANVMARQQATASGVTEAILVRDGLVTEGAASNVFAVIEGELRTPPKGAYILPGITRDLVLELAHEQGIACRECDIRVGELGTAQELWMTSSTKEVLPITSLDQVAVGDGKPGPVFERMYRIYQDYKDEFRAGRRD